MQGSTAAKDQRLSVSFLCFDDKMDKAQTPCSKRSRKVETECNERSPVSFCPALTDKSTVESIDRLAIANALTALVGMSSTPMDSSSDSSRANSPIQFHGGNSHRKRSPPPDVIQDHNIQEQPSLATSQAYAGADLHAQMMRYGATLFSKDDDGNYVCFFEKCTQRMSNNFSRHVFGHEQRGDHVKEHLRRQEAIHELCFVDQTFSTNTPQRKRSSRRGAAHTSPSSSTSPVHKSSSPPTRSLTPKSLSATNSPTGPLPISQNLTNSGSKPMTTAANPADLLFMLATSALTSNGQIHPDIAPARNAAPATRVPTSSHMPVVSSTSTNVGPSSLAPRNTSAQGVKQPATAVKQQQILEAMTAIQLMIRALSSCPVAL